MRPRDCRKPFPAESTVSMYLVGEVLFSFSWQYSCLQVKGGTLNYPRTPRTCSPRSVQGLGGVMAGSAPASGHGSSPHLRDADSSTGCFQLSLLLPRASRTACLWAAPTSPSLPHKAALCQSRRKLLVASGLFKWRLSRHKHLICAFSFSG